MKTLGLSVWDRRVIEAKARILTEALVAREGCRSCTATDLGMKRPNLCRLIRELGVAVPGRTRVHLKP